LLGGRGVSKLIVRLMNGESWAYLELAIWIVVFILFYYLRKWWIEH
jgi:predicted RND superfamily exporter protein